MFQRGFVPILVIILAAVILAGSGFYLLSQQNSSQPPVVTRQDLSNNETEVKSATPSLKPSAKSNGIPIKVTTSLSTTQPKSFPLGDGNNPPPVAPEIIINAAGSYTYSGQEINYAISFAKNGGAVTGNVSGICTGPINGNFSGGDGGLIKSGVDAKCKIGIFEQDLNADFEGKVYFSQGRADLEWQGQIPFYSGSKQFSLSFTPL